MARLPARRPWSRPAISCSRLSSVPRWSRCRRAASCGSSGRCCITSSTASRLPTPGSLRQTSGMVKTRMGRPPFHADQVGSLLRPKELHDARAAAKAGKLAPPELKAIEDRAIAQAVKKQEAVGLQAVTDGEFRRDFWHLDFLKQLDGIELTRVTGLTFNAEDVPPMVSVAGKIACSRPIMVDHFQYLKSVATRMPKFTMPSPGSAHFRGGRNAISRTVYPDLEEFWADLGAAYRTGIRHLYDAGCRYFQLDDVGFSYLCDDKVRENFRKNGDDPRDLPRAYADPIAMALKDRPADLGVTMHTCRGNFRSTWFAAGGYQDQAVGGMVSARVHGFFIEYDSERAGGFPSAPP